MTKTRVITIAHATGADGDRIGRRVAESLGFRYVDEEIIQLAALRHGVDAELVADAERRKTLLERVINDIGLGPMFDAGGMTMLPPEALVTRADLQTVIVDAIKETAEHGHVVIVSHGAGIPLAGRADVLRVLVTASFDVRAQRVADASRIKKADAEKTLRESDAGRADYFQRFHRIERELPTHYDLVVSTDVLQADEAADIVIAAARRH